MIDFTKFSAEGRVLFTGRCQLETLALQGSNVIQGRFDSETSYIDTQTMVAVAKPARPSPFHEFDYAAKAWVDPRTLQDFKDAKWVEIKAAREAAEFGTFVWDGSTFDCDAESQARLRAAADRARRDSTTSITWRLADNSSRTLLASALDAVGNALDVHVATQHAIASALREQITAATLVAQLQNIHWPI